MAGRVWRRERRSCGHGVLAQNLAVSEPAQGREYPEPFIFTTTKDDRTGPQHARKFAARMEEYGLPFLYYENTEGGHGSGADIKQTARSNALQMTYFVKKLMD